MQAVVGILVLIIVIIASVLHASRRVAGTPGAARIYLWPAWFGGTVVGTYIAFAIIFGILWVIAWISIFIKSIMQWLYIAILYPLQWIF